MERRTACRWLWILDLIIRDFLQHWIGRIVGTLNSSKWFCLSWFRGCRIFCGDYFLNLATNCKIISHLINQLINNCFMCTADSSWSHLQLLPSQHAFLCVCMCDRLFYICVGSSHINMKYIFFLKRVVCTLCRLSVGAVVLRVGSLLRITSAPESVPAIIQNKSAVLEKVRDLWLSM